MSFAVRLTLPLALLSVSLLTGCRSLVTETEDGRRVKRWSDEWYANEAQRPVGVRQREHFGKLWPPFARPTGKSMQFSHKFHHAHYWPYPYNCQDRDFVRTLSDRQVNNGWIAHTTLYDHHFDEDTRELNTSGLLKLQWILEHAPTDRRKVSVQTGAFKDISQQRLATVRDASMKIAGEANMPPISLRVSESLGRPAMEVDAIRRSELNSMPDPRIIYTALPSGTGDGGG